MKTRRLLVLVLAICLVIVSGCFQHTFNVGQGAPDGAIAYKHWHHHWLFGLIRPKLQKEVDVEEFCPSGNATIHEEVSFVNGLIGVLIGVIYSPTTVTIRCDNGNETEIELSGEEVSEIVHDPVFLEVVERMFPQRLAEVRLALAREESDRRIAVRAPAPADGEARAYVPGRASSDYRQSPAATKLAQ